MINKNYSQVRAEIDSLIGRGIERGLERVLWAVDKLGHPEKEFSVVHVAGTNGKGSTCALIASILQEAGYKTGLVVSPHVIDMRERIQINGHFIPLEALCEIHESVKSSLGSIPCTFFEWFILLAFVYFKEQKVDIAVLETGMGGRWDATNCTQALVGAITNVSYDHQEYLGETLKEILGEKMQIIKEGMICWTGITESDLLMQLEDFCRLKNVDLFCLKDFFLEGDKNYFKMMGKNYPIPALEGKHQKKNAALAIGILKSLQQKGWRIDESHYIKGLRNVFWPARLELIKSNPPILLDGAHNLLGVENLVEYLQEKQLKPHLVFSTLRNRPFKEMLCKLLPHVKTVTIACFDDERAFLEQDLLRYIHQLEPCIDKKLSLLKINASNWEGYCKTKQSQETILVTGSLYLVSQIRHLITGGMYL